MSDDQLSWKNLLSSDPSKKSPDGQEPSETNAANPAPEAAPASARPKRATRTTKKTTTTHTSETRFAQLDWAPLGTQTNIQANTQISSQKPETTTVPTSVLVTEDVTKVKISSETLTAKPSRGMPTVQVKETVTTVQTQTATLFKAPASAPLINLEDDDEDEFADLVAKDEEPEIFSVYELNKQIRGLLEGKFPIIWVRGELSNFKAHTSGHFYFSLKDSKAQITAVMFKGFNQQLKFKPHDGMEVIVRGRVTVYEPRGNYQLFCEMMEPVGAGALQKAFEQLKAKLQAEGLFDQSRKRPLPALPRHIAIVTSPTGAAIRDMLNVLGRRFKGVRITLIPARVQGDGAAAEICAAIDLANRLSDVDVMIVGRGGGSIEDMWCFNEEPVARAIAAARVPVISAVGHEIDFTIADFVADLRAPTPSAAAELVIKNAADLAQRVEQQARSLRLATLRLLEAYKSAVQNLGKRLIDPQRRIQDCMLRSDELSQRLENAFARFVNDHRMNIALMREKLGNPEQRIAANRQAVKSLSQRLSTGWMAMLERKKFDVEKNMALLDSLSPLRVVERGYSLVTANDQIVNDVTQIKEGETVCIQFARGRASAEIKVIENKKGVTDRES